jgi:hypothetical protein
MKQAAVIIIIMRRKQQQGQLLPLDMMTATKFHACRSTLLLDSKQDTHPKMSFVPIYPTKRP